MMQDTCTRGGHHVFGAPARAARVPALLLLLLLAGCSGAGGVWSRGAANAPVTPAVAVPQDPVAAFAATATPGAQGRIALAGGQPAAVRLVRAYYAASGRECREVLVGAGVTQRSEVVCRTEAGAWVSARPLLRGGGIPRS